MNMQNIPKDKPQQVSLFVLKGVLQLSNKSVPTLEIPLRNYELN